MSLRHAILALLTVEPMTGYDLYKQFESSVGYVWHAPDSQLYPMLRRMEDEGLLDGEEVSWGQRGKKRRYTATAAGIAEFRHWMNTPLEYSRERDPIHLKAAYLEWAEPASARAQMIAHRDHFAERLVQWQIKVHEIDTGTSPMLAKRLAVIPAAEHAATIAFKRFTYEGMIAHARQEIEWAEHGVKLIDELAR